MFEIKTIPKSKKSSAAKMNRTQLIQEIFKKTNFTGYLEIGCLKGKSFLPEREKNKTSVDAVFKMIAFIF